MREKLKAERKLQGLTQERTAKQIGVTSRQYQAIEAGTSNGSMKVWNKLSELLNKPIDYLIFQADTPTPTE